MKNLIFIVFIFIGFNTLGQGLGLSMSDVITNRSNEDYIFDNEDGIYYLKYKCRSDQMCSDTYYLLDNLGDVAIVIDVFKYKFIQDVLLYLNNNASKLPNFEWIDKKENNLITLAIDKENNKFSVIYMKHYE